MDINDLSLKLIKLKKKRGGFKLYSFMEKEINPGIIEEGIIKNEEELAKIVKEAVKNVEGRKLKTKYVVASLPEEKSFLQIIQMPRMKEEELKTAVFFEAENYIPLPVSEVYLDFKIIAPAKNSSLLDILIVATPKKIVNAYVSVLKKAGLFPIALEVESEAMARALVKENSATAPIALLDFGKTNTDLVVFCGNSIYFTCSFKVSSGQLTKVISEKLKISLDKAEKMKIKYGLSLKEKSGESKEVSNAMRPVLEELLEQIKKYLNFYQDHASQKHYFPEEKIEKIFISGGGAEMKGLAEFLSKNLKIQAMPGVFWTDFLPKNQKKSTLKNPLAFASAVGLALKNPNEIINI